MTTDRLALTVFIAAPVIRFSMSEIDLGAKHQGVLRPARSVSAVVEHGALEIDDVLEIGSQIPVEAGGPGLGLLTGAGGREAESEGALVHGQCVVSRGNLESAVVPGAEVEV